jgi:hypothetical protein
MALSRGRLLYIIAVLISGIAVGLLMLQQPPFAVSLVLDLAIGQLAAQNKTEPLTMGDRFVAVIGAGLIVTVMVALG